MQNGNKAIENFFQTDKLYPEIIKMICFILNEYNRIHMRYFLKALILFISLSAIVLNISFSNANDLNDRVKDVVLSAHKKTVALQIDNKKWDFPSYLGNNWASTFYLFMKWREQPSYLQNSDIKGLERDLLSTQNKNGSWTPIYDANDDLSNISATVINYFALKVMNVSINSEPMERARDYILANGGIEKSNLFTKIILALFDNYSWDKLPKIPMVFFESTPIHLIASTDKFAQWIGPNLMPIAYLKRYQIHKNLGNKFNIQELFVSDTIINNKETPIDDDHLMAINLMKEILKNQKKHGSFGAYIPATFFSYMAITHYEKKFPSKDLNLAKENALIFLKNLIIRNGKMSTLGLVDDGHVWDTALISLGLSRSKYKTEALRPTGNYLISTQVEEGGYPFGFDFEQYPDTDDTAIIILSLAEIGGYEKQNQKAVKWLFKMQSSDGGWGAFARNNTGNLVLRKFAKDFEDSADLFDESSPDVTGHVLEALGKMGYTKENSKEVRRGISYLKKPVTTSLPAWTGRWGVNYIYGTGAALAGLYSVGESMDEPYINNAKDWLISIQNKDGGFGETTKSYIDPAYAGIGVSTTSQTAWGLIGLLKTVDKKNPAVIKSVKYLLKEFNSKKGWHDISTVGTGHPKIIYMNYPSYPLAFPLIALGEYLRE